MIEMQVTGLVEAEATYKRLRDGVDRAAYITMESEAQALAHELAQASPIGAYDEEPGHQPVPRNPGELAASWHVAALNQYTVAVFSNVWYSRLLLFPDAEKAEWTIQARGGGAQAGGIGNQPSDIAKSYSTQSKGMLLFQGQQDGMNVLIDQVTRQKQDVNQDMLAVLDTAQAQAEARTRNLFGQALQDYVQVR